MELANTLTTKQIVPEMVSMTSTESIEELVNKLHEIGTITESCKTNCIRSLIEREDKTTTGIGSGVAIPHTFSSEVKELKMIFGRSMEGIDFEAIDNNPVNFVILFIMPEGNKNHLQTLSAIAKFFTKGGIREKLLEANTKEDIINVFKEQD
ncbi:MAG: PTS sugar transporter subunit IIA [Akkermansiaceae bacterium]|jgi:mannitol/fructose-specific phosphotransferase system IIA component (Ntr-type)|nr:PTS sugar transporter subunit IIA [Akkermansiaceae bacterium]MDG1854206.1 PTS sugar transporter subunit IIA [Verrucomicrobiales bacterium]